SAQPLARRAGEYELAIAIRNSGEAHWLGQAQAAGEVRLGVQLVGADGRLQTRDFLRFALDPAGAAPGAEQVVRLRLALADAAGGRFRFDLVAEQVSWFSQNGRTSTIDWPQEQLS